VLEALRCDYPWASDRLHQFVLGGMADNQAAFARTDVLYYPYVLALEVDTGTV
jgi:deoxyribodipyrimidine photo-lyase